MVKQFSMKYSTIDKLVFIASFVWMMNWGVRVTSVAINYALS